MPVSQTAGPTTTPYFRQSFIPSAVVSLADSDQSSSPTFHQNSATEPSQAPSFIKVNVSSQSSKSSLASSNSSSIAILAVGVSIPILLLLIPFILWKIWSMKPEKSYACVPSCSPEDLMHTKCMYSNIFDICGRSDPVGGGMDLSMIGGVGNNDILGPSSHGHLNVNVVLSETVRV